jgi:hypothetical protein
MAGRKAERALAAKEKRRDARRGRVTAPEPATPEQQLAGSPMMMMEVKGLRHTWRWSGEECCSAGAESVDPSDETSP